MRVSALRFWVRPGLASLVCVILFVAVGGGLHAQDPVSALSGLVLDQSGAVVPGVVVSIINVGTGWQRSTQTNPRGFYEFLVLPPGRYVLTAEMTGFAFVTVNNLLVRGNRASAVNITLRPGALAESIVVEGEAQQLGLHDATRSLAVTQEQVSLLPVFTSPSGRNVLDTLPFLVPGVFPGEPLGGLGLPEAGLRGEGLSIAGHRPLSINYSLGGGDNNDGELNIAASPLPNPDALQELRIITNNYTADLGRSSGGLLDATVKKGGNRLHGNLRYFYLNERLNARSFFDVRKPRSRLNTLGAQLGGPVVQDRVFFFVDYEGNSSDVSSQRLVTVPTLPWRIGDFSALPPSQWPIDPFTGDPFPGGVIPPTRFNPAALELLSLIPSPEEGEDGFHFIQAGDQRLDQVTFRGDIATRSSDTLSVTYFWNQVDSTDSNFGAPSDSTVETGETSQNLVFRETHIFSPKAVNEVASSLSLRDDEARTRYGRVDGVPPGEFGFDIAPQTSRFLGPPTVSFVNFSYPIGSFSPSVLREQATWQIRDDLTLEKGPHLLRLGAEIHGLRMSAVQGNNNGSFGYFGATNCCGTGLDFADFLLGLAADSYVQTSGNTIRPRQQGMSAYLMDEWRWLPNLTLNVGLRYEFVQPMRDVGDQVNVFRPGAQSQVFPQAPQGLLFVGDPDPVLGEVPRGGYPPDKNNFAPRLGIAYSPRPKSGLWNTLLGDGKTAIRVGAGLFYDHTYGRTFTEFQEVQPFSVVEFIPSTLGESAGASLDSPFGSLPNNWPLDPNERTFRSPPQVQAFDPSFRMAYSFHYNLTIQRALPGRLLLESVYVGSSSFKLNREQERNPAVLGPGATPTNIEQRRFDPRFSSIPIQESTGRGIYNSVQLRLARKFAGPLSFDVSYVWSKALDNGSAPVGAGNRLVDAPGVSSTFPLLWARSAFDRRHNFVASYTYVFPTLDRGFWWDFFFNGWEVGGITQLRSGLPLDISQAIDSTLTGEARRGRPDLLGRFQRLEPRPDQTVNGQTGHFFFDPTIFQAVFVTDFTEARRGTLGRNAFSGPGQNMTSLSVVKQFRILESHLLELRSDISNLFNHTNFAPPETLLERSTFGQVTSAAPGRRIQLSARFSF